MSIFLERVEKELKEKQTKQFDAKFSKCSNSVSYEPMDVTDPDCNSIYLY